MTKQLRIDPTKCDGVGICAIKAPDLIRLDDWGFPLIAEQPLNTPDLMRQAEHAVNACPKRALLLLEQDSYSLR